MAMQKPEGKPRSEDTKESTLGFVSYTISLVCFYLEFVSVLFLRLNPRLQMLQGPILGGLLATLVGALLGLIALFQGTRNKRLAIFGLIINLCVFFGRIWALGVLAEEQGWFL
jgi:hypothetical protein